MKLAAALVVVSGPCVSSAQAQAAFDPAKGFNPSISDATVAELSAAVLDAMPRLQCGRIACTPATPAERQRGLISPADAREVVRKGMVSQVGACVGLPWEEVGFLPMMADWRSGRRASDRQLAFVGALHGAAMQWALDQMGGSCPKD